MSTLDVQTAPLAFTHVTVIDSMGPLSDRTVLVAGARIQTVGKSGETAVPESARIVDASGQFLIPGLWDMHIHAVFPDRLGSMLPMCIANGVLGIRDMGTSMPPADIGRIRREIATGSWLGPRIVAAGPMLDGRPKPLRPNFLAITTAQQGREAARSLKTGGADLIKVYSWLSRDSFLAIADEANKLALPISGHVPFSVSALEASDAGMKSMEHQFGVYLSCSSREDELRSEMLMSGVNLSGADRVRLEAHEAIASYDPAKAARAFAHLARNRTWQVPTFAAVLANSLGFDERVTTDPRLKYIPRGVQKRWKDAASAGSLVSASRYQRQLEIGGAMHRAGVPLLAGTDAAWYQPYTYAGFSMHDELGLMVRAGLKPLEALRAATLDPAVYLGLNKDLGTIAKGKLADAVLLSADPLSDIGNTRKIDSVLVNGRLLDRKALDGLLAGAENEASR